MSATRILVLGFLWAITSTSIGGVTVVLTRLIISESDPLTFAALRYSLGGLFLFGILLITTKMPKIDRQDWLPIIGLGIVMFAVFPFFMARSLEETTAARGALLFATMPLITVLISSIFKIEKLTSLKLIAVVFAIAGTTVALGEPIEEFAPNALLGDFFMFCGMVSVSIFNVFSKKYLVRYGNLPLTVYLLFFGVTTLVILAMIFGEPFNGSLSFDLNGWLIVLILAVPGGAVMFIAWGRALQMITPTQAAITTGFNPLTAILLGAWLLTEPISIQLLGGFALILLAIFIAGRSDKPITSPPVNI